MDRSSLRIAVIGAGPSGIATGHELLKKDFSEFTLFEKAAKPGETWHAHTYPGLACDVWAFTNSRSPSLSPGPVMRLLFGPTADKLLRVVFHALHVPCANPRGTQNDPTGTFC